MTKELIERYESLRDSINDNINTIRHLLLTADRLSGVVAEIKGDDEKKKELERNVTELYQTINTLIKQTNELFKQYAEFASSVERVRT